MCDNKKGIHDKCLSRGRYCILLSGSKCLKLNELLLELGGETTSLLLRLALPLSTQPKFAQKEAETAWRGQVWLNNTLSAFFLSLFWSNTEIPWPFFKSKHNNDKLIQLFLSQLLLLLFKKRFFTFCILFNYVTSCWCGVLIKVSERFGYF